MLSGNLPDIDSDMLSCITFGILFDILFGILSDACMFWMRDGQSVHKKK